MGRGRRKETGQVLHRNCGESDFYSERQVMSRSLAHTDCKGQSGIQGTSQGPSVLTQTGGVGCLVQSSNSGVDETSSRVLDVF